MGCGNSALVQDFDDDKNSSVENIKKKQEDRINQRAHPRTQGK